MFGVKLHSVLCCSAFVLAAMPARAADLPLPRVAALPQKNLWDGFYAGGHVGYVFAGTSAFATDGSALPLAGSTSIVGEEHIDGAHGYGPISAGFQAGYNHAFASGLLIGAKADFSFPGPWTGSASPTPSAASAATTRSFSASAGSASTSATAA